METETWLEWMIRWMAWAVPRLEEGKQFVDDNIADDLETIRKFMQEFVQKYTPS